MLNFEFSSQQKMLRDLAHTFAENEIKPVAEFYDQHEEFPWPVVEKALENGLLSVNIPEEYDGPGMNLLEECILNEELAWGCSGIQTSLMLNSLASLPIIISGSEEQKQKYLTQIAGGTMAAYCVTEPGAGSDVAGLKTYAERQGDVYILNGVKTWITNGPVSDIFVVFAKTDRKARYEGISAFIVERDWGVKTGKSLPKMGQHASKTCEVFFENVEVPVENRLGPEGNGFLTAMKVFDSSRPAVAAAAVGVARRAFEEATEYAKTRMAYGKPIIALQGISFMLADMAMNIEAGRMLAHKAAWLLDQGQSNTMLAAYAKAFCADMAMKVTTDAVQVFGGYGYSQEYPVEKLMRDAKIFQIYEGTSQVQRHIIARELAR
ncbi:MAG: acyl-CoA dehydrogenase family protein [Caldilineales bacterium]|nr:acyl-CoA dehydrogenase family protein [Caldilineales bacterium]